MYQFNHHSFGVFNFDFRCEKVIEEGKDADNNDHNEEIKPFQLRCKVCNKKFKTLFWYKKHASAHTNVKTYACDLCDKVFREGSILRCHKRQIHSLVKRFKCDHCDYSSNNKVNFASHVKVLHTDVNQSNIKCDNCELRFFKEEDLMRHRIKEHNAPRFTCQICEKSYTSKQYLNIHKAIHKPGFKPEHLCAVCGKLFPNSGRLSSHLRMRHSNKKYDCTICGKSVTSRSSLRDHIRSHTGDRPHICQVCGKAFAVAKYLRLHMRLHTGERPYKCEYCVKTFIQRSSLAIHIRHHIT
jgi:KRAB domain-containing zinc finger protein